jgi:hypothetical protein
MFSCFGRLIGKSRSFTTFPDHVITAAHRLIGMPHLVRSYLGGEVGQIAQRRAHILRKREDALVIANADLRECVLSYLDFYESRLPDEERELVQRTTARELDDLRARRHAEEAKVKALLDSEARAHKSA